MSDPWGGWPQQPDDPAGWDDTVDDGGGPPSADLDDGYGPYGVEPVDGFPDGPGTDPVTPVADPDVPRPDELGQVDESWRDLRPPPRGYGQPEATDPYADDSYLADVPDGAPTPGVSPPEEDWTGVGSASDADPDSAPAPDERASDEVGYPPSAPPFGADPDLSGDPDPAASGEPHWAAGFPAPIRFGTYLGGAPEPVDGYPWADPDLLGDAPPVAAQDEPGPAGATFAARPDPADLAGYAAVDLPPGTDPWPALAAVDDPATAALARFWAPTDPVTGDGPARG